ncbi:MAG TPA: hypothetical protein P5080_05720 [Candidatus Paceibacterota bacterium]|nr:hypothetical protein [Candidatus Pacearchaeota archaeon]HRZ51434.1 hypothetical protein [Candidatus Paceibacterota bacterium]HSA37165.1 hypothetical protein [Candidatus Paceibacterota bacterium]
MEYGLAKLAILFVSNCLVLAPFCRYANKKMAICLRWGAITTLMEAMMLNV